MTVADDATSNRRPAGVARMGGASTQWLVGALILGATFLLSHPYTGVRHDGILYAGEALSRILPGEFHDDPYFLFGSQGKFTLMPNVYAWLIASFGIGLGTIVGMLAAFALYLSATAYLVRQLVPSRLTMICLLSIVLGWSIYGGHRIFAYAEPFLTARSFAEPSNLLALALVIRGRLLIGLLVLMLAFAIHPLISVGGALVIWCYLVLQDRRWLLLAAAGGLVLGICAMVGFGPFADVFSRYDAQWLEYVQDVNPQAFVLSWTMLDWGVVLYNAAVVLLAARFAATAAQRRFAWAVLCAAALALTTSVLLVDIVLNPFVGKLQISRTVWLMQWMTMACLPLVVAALWKRGEHGRLAALFLMIGWVAPFSVVPGILAMMALLVDSVGRRVDVTSATTRIVGVVGALAVVIIAVQFEFRVIQVGWAQQQTTRQIVSQAVGLNLLLLPLAYFASRQASRLGIAAPLIALLAFGSAMMAWDQRSPWKHELESSAPGHYLWPGVIEPAARVYWFRDLMAPWLLLGHSNYYTDQQASGAVFSRDMVVELQKRQKVTAFLDFQEQICRMMNNLNEKPGSCEPDAATVRTLCMDSGIDYVVLQSSLNGALAVARYDTGVVENGYEKKFFLYRCSALKPG